MQMTRQFRREMVIAMMEQGVNVTQMARILRVSRQTIYRDLRARGWRPAYVHEQTGMFVIRVFDE